ncbi:CBS domain-containing protein [Streptacidiphilus sp. ASG 303]|uniref:CBS domain-containing protein n=1 Tax=Streptomycetaceae TaxID=2062 RepID=UPI001E516BCA|nr:CBS domain-containing protein [Streptacidiphilus sp. ASG 303]MCD0484496.1 CBS domain-containing protein [Streptacidiphilus sp. ASG 303]
MAAPYRVRDVMSTPVVAVSRHAPFKEIAAAMGHWRISALPVLDADRRVVGVVSEADLLQKEAYRGYEPSRREQLQQIQEIEKAGGVTASDVMTGPAVCVAPDVPLAEAARLMARHHVKRLPVVDAERRPVGVVSRTDLLKVFLRADGQLADEVRRELAEGLPGPASAGVSVTVVEGVVTLDGEVGDACLVPVAARLARAVEGVVGVDCRLHAPHPQHREPPRTAPLY